MVSIIRRNPGAALAVRPFYSPLSVFDEIEEMLRDFDTGLLTPKLDMYEEKGDLVVKAEFPGVKKKDLDISIEDDVLTIRAEKKQEKEAKEATHYTCERSFGSYSRSIMLPAHVDADKVSATFKKGLLEMRLPKVDKPESKRIEVKAR